LQEYIFFALVSSYNTILFYERILMVKYTRDQIEVAIKLYFGSKKKCAKALGISESTLSRNLNKLSNSFIQRLKGVGVLIGSFEYKYPDKKALDIISEENNVYHHLTLEELVTMLKDQHKLLKIELYELRKEFEALKSQVKLQNK